jgi:hypothetical protein
LLHPVPQARNGTRVPPIRGETELCPSAHAMSHFLLCFWFPFQQSSSL